ncbi:MAG: FapA family protein [bacterium]
MDTNGTTDTQAAIMRRIRVVISQDQLIARMIVQKPDPGESDITQEDVIEALKLAGIVYGIDNEVIARIVAEKVCDTPVEIAKGDPPVKGEDTKFEYLFNTDSRGVPKEDKDGRIDYRELHFIQNTDKEAVLARRTAPTTGVNGKSVDGKEINATRGRNVPFKFGDNTKVSSDGMTLTATAAGAIVFRSGMITVKDVMTINGDVDFNTGNIECNGSVIVRGDARTGFKLDIGGNLEVAGNVQDCHISCRGNILVRGGCFGEGEGSIQADGDITVKYAQGQKLISGGQINVGGELINCRVTAKERVLVVGKRGKIVGGEINAGKEIRAPFLGSEGGTPTVLTVAYDADLMRQYHKTIHEMERLDADQERVKEGLTGLYRLQMDGKLSDAKVAAIKQFEDFQRNVPDAIRELEKRKAGIEEKLREYRDATIIAENTMYPGVEAHFGIASHQVTEAMQVCKLTIDGSQVLFSEYIPGK